MQHTGNQAELLVETRAPESFRMRTLVLCFFAVVMDGYDTAAVGFASPAMAADWGLSSASFTPAFVGTGIGAVLGFLLAGPLAQRWGHRLVMLVSLVWFGAASLVTLSADSIASLAILRVITALGLGAAVPLAIALASEYSKRRYRELAATVVGMGFGVGVVMGGIVAKPLLAAHPWTSIFLVGGLAPIVALPVFLVWLPQSFQIAVGRFRHTSSTARLLARLGISAADIEGPHTTDAVRFDGRKHIVAQLLAPELRRSTALLWAFAFLIFMNTYMFTFWTPLLLTSFGFSAADAAIGPTAFGAGSLIGALLAMPAITRFGVMRLLVVTSLIGAAAVAVLGLVDLERPWILLMLALAGAGMAFGNIGQGAAAVSIYAPEARATGIGCAAAIGRIGGILGPALAGALLYFEWPVQEVILTACVPSVLAAVVMFVLAAGRGARVSGAERQSAKGCNRSAR